MAWMGYAVESTSQTPALVTTRRRGATGEQMKARVYAIDSPTWATVKKWAVRPAILLPAPGRRLALVLLAAGRDGLVGLAPPPGDATPTGACNDLYGALGAYAACFFPPDQLQPPRHDRFVLNCVQHLSAPGADSASDAAERCVAAIRAAAPTCGTIDTTACMVPPGSLATGQPCGTAMQCASNYCVGSGQPPVFVDAGAACNGFDILCSTGSCSTNLGGNGPPPGRCPSIIADGDPCPAPSGAAGLPVCDDYASCTSATGAVDAGGACVLLDPAACH